MYLRAQTPTGRPYIALKMRAHESIRNMSEARLRSCCPDEPDGRRHSRQERPELEDKLSGDGESGDKSGAERDWNEIGRAGAGWG